MLLRLDEEAETIGDRCCEKEEWSRLAGEML